LLPRPMLVHGTRRICTLVILALLVETGRCQGPSRDNEPPCTENCDAWTLLQNRLGFATGRPDGLSRVHDSENGGTPATSSEARAPMISFVDGDIAEIRDWIPCSIAGPGDRPDTYNIRVQGKSGASKEVQNIPMVGLRRTAGRAGNYGTLPPSDFAAGEQALVVRWVPCSVSSKGSARDSYTVVVPEWKPALVNDVPVTRLRKIRSSNWLYNADPTLPSKIPGQTTFCRTEESCTKVLTECVATKSGLAARNCGGRCDAVFVGDSILERLTGWLCYSRNPKFKDEAEDAKKAFQDIIAVRHPKSFILAGASDETAQTLYMLDQALPKMIAPAMYFVMVGTNNIPKGGSAHALHGLRAVVAKLRTAHPSAHVMMHALLPRADDKVLHFQTHIEEVNRELAAFVAAERAKGVSIEFVDCTGTLHPRAQRAEDFDDIMVHPTPKGYRTWLSCVSPSIDRALAAIADK